jgi:site-specific DNA recombinase
MRAVIYCRVSTEEQRERNTIASQLSTLPRFIESQGWKLVKPADTYVDEARSAKAGLLDKREAFGRLLKDAARGAFDVVVVVDMDRLSRSEDLAERGAILGAFQKAGVKLATASTGQVLDLASSMGDLLSSLQLFFSAEENRKRAERVRRGRQEAARRGRPSAKAPWGYVFDRKTGEWSHDPEVAPLVREMYERILRGDSTGEIGVDMHKQKIPNPRGGSWERHRVHKIVTSPAYRGEWLANVKEKITIKLPPMVDETTWYAVQAALMAGKERGRWRVKHTHLLQGIAVCGLCESPINIHDPMSGGARTPYYVCGKRRHRKAFGEKCALPLRRVSDRDEALWRKVCALLSKPEHLARALDKRGKQARTQGDATQQAKGRLAQLERAQAALLERFGRGLITEAVMDETLGKMAQERRQLTQKVAEAEHAAAKSKDEVRGLRDLQAKLDKLQKGLKHAKPELRRRIVDVLMPGGEFRAKLMKDGSIKCRMIIDDTEVDGVPMVALARHGATDSRDCRRRRQSSGAIG